MAATDASILSSFTGVGQSVLMYVVLFIVFIFFVGIASFIAYSYAKSKRFKQYKCIIFEEDGFGQNQISYDEGGVFIDKKTNNKRFFLKKNSSGLTPDNIPYVMNQKGEKFVFLFRTGLKNFRYINFKLDAKSFGIEVGEEDVNWAVNAYERMKRTFQQSLLMQLLPFIAIAFTVVVILIIFIFFFKQFPILKDVAESFKQAAQALAAANSGTKIV